MLQLHLVITPAPGGLKQILEMQRLPEINHVQHGVRMPRLHAVSNRGQVAGRVGEGAVFLANESRGFILAQENDHCPFAFLSNPPLQEATNDLWQHRIVEAFSMSLVNMNVEPAIDPVDL